MKARMWAEYKSYPNIRREIPPKSSKFETLMRLFNWREENVNFTGNGHEYIVESVRYRERLQVNQRKCLLATKIA